MTSLQPRDMYDNERKSCPSSKAVCADPDLDLDLPCPYLWQKQYTSHTMPTIE